MAENLSLNSSKFVTTSPQQDIWLVADSKLRNKGTTYSLGFRVEINGPLSLDVFNNSISKTVHENEVLRTSYTLKDGVYFQEIHSEIQFDLPCTDHSDLDAAAREEVYARVFAESFVLGLPNYRAPLWKLNLFKESESRFIFIFGMHHSINDARGLYCFVEEVVRNYDSLIKNGVDSKEVPEYQYGTYSIDFRNRIAEGELDESLEYWQGVISEAESGPETKKEIVKAKIYLAEVPLSVFNSLKVFCSENGLLFSSVLLGTIGMLLADRLKKNSSYIEMLNFGRSDKRLWKMIGEFSSTCPLKVDISENPSFFDLLNRVNDELMMSMENEYPPTHKYSDSLCNARFNFIPKPETIKSETLEIVVNSDAYFKSDTGRVSSQVEGYYLFVDTGSGMQVVIRAPGDNESKREFSEKLKKFLPTFFESLVKESGTKDLQLTEIFSKFK